MNKEAKRLINSPFLNWLAVIAFATIIFSFSSMTPTNLEKEAPSFIVLIPDWGAHFLEYFIFGVLIYRALFVSGYKNRAAFLAVLIAFLYGITDEIHQIFVPERIFSVKDMLVNFIGAATAQIIKYKKIFLK